MRRNERAPNLGLFKTQEVVAIALAIVATTINKDGDVRIRITTTQKTLTNLLDQQIRLNICQVCRGPK